MTSNISFIKEQDGTIEMKFKQAVCLMLVGCIAPVRAYLAQVRYDSLNKDLHIAICIKTLSSKNEELLIKLKNIFMSMFVKTEHLDIIFINDEQEKMIRKVCCPFFTSPNFQFLQPDFYLTSSEGYNLNKTKPIACFKRKRLYGSHPDGYILCDIKPMLFGSDYDLEQKEISQIVVACRHLNYSLFPINSWPALVHVAVPQSSSTVDNITMFIEDKDIILIAWGELTISQL